MDDKNTQIPVTNTDETPAGPPAVNTEVVESTPPQAVMDVTPPPQDATRSEFLNSDGTPITWQVDQKEAAE